MGIWKSVGTPGNSRRRIDALLSGGHCAAGTDNRKRPMPARDPLQRGIFAITQKVTMVGEGVAQPFERLEGAALKPHPRPRRRYLDRKSRSSIGRRRLRATALRRRVEPSCIALGHLLR